MNNMSLQEEIKQILEPPHNLFKIVNQFADLSQKQHSAFINEAEHWHLQLYELVAHFFTIFLSNNVPHKQTRLIQEICRRAEKDTNQILFGAYYAYLGKDFVNQEISFWIESNNSSYLIATISGK